MFSKFVERQVVRDAYAELAARTKDLGLPEVAGQSPEPGGPNASIVATAFDYIVRFRLARWVMTGNNPVQLWDTGWVAERAVESMQGHKEFGQHYERWFGIVHRARDLFANYAVGKEDSIDSVATCAQYLGNADMLNRIGQFNPGFRHRQDVQTELLGLTRILDDSARFFRPTEWCFLNPSFVAARAIGGADVGLLVDDAVIDIKTTVNPSVSTPLLRKLATYAALQRIGGVDLLTDDDGKQERWEGDVRRVAVYFARQGKFVDVMLDDLMPRDGFSQFTEIVRRELTQPGV